MVVDIAMISLDSNIQTIETKNKNMSKYVASFRLGDTSAFGELSYNERYELLMSYFRKQNSFVEESTTSLVYFQSTKNVVDLGNDIIKNCRLLNSDEILLFQYDNGSLTKVDRINDNTVYKTKLTDFLKS